MNQASEYAILSTAWGWIGLAGTKHGLRRTTLPQASEAEARLILEELTASAVESPDAFKELTARLRAYFSGIRTDFPDRLDLSTATSFQRRVWEATRLIPYGETSSYAWVARRLGKPGAARAVGQALHRNPFPIIIPCHRVLASDGGLGGFGSGLDTKRRLLKLESAATRLSPNQG